VIQEAAITISLFINPDIVSLMEHHYDNVAAEYSFCLIATIRGPEASIDRIGTLDVIHADHDTVTVRYDNYPCDQYTNVIGMLHPHLDNTWLQYCGMSRKDYVTWKLTPFPFNFIQCGSRTWTIFGNQQHPRRSVFRIHEDNTVEWLIGGPGKTIPRHDLEGRPLLDLPLEMSSG